MHATTFCRAFLIASLALIGEARATTIVGPPTEASSDRADLVIVAQVVSVASEWSHGRILSRVAVKVDETLEGTAPPALELLSAGGVIDGVRMEVIGAPRWRPGERAVLRIRHTRFGDQVLGMTSMTPTGPPGSLHYVRTTTSVGTPVAWRDVCARMVLDGRENPDVPHARLLPLLQRALSRWTGPLHDCTSFFQPTLEIAGDHGETGYDGVSRILWRLPGFCDDPAHAASAVCLSPEAAAITTIFYVDKPGDARDGELLEADIVINADAHRFSDTGSPTELDLESVMTHELGHLLGLNHTCYTGSGSAPPVDHTGTPIPPCFPVSQLPDELVAATMFNFIEAGDTSKRDPLDGELSALCAIYADHPSACAPLDPGCSCRGTPSTGGVLLLVAAGMWMLRSKP